MMPPFVVFPTNRIAHFVEVSLYLFYLAQQVNLSQTDKIIRFAPYLIRLKSTILFLRIKKPANY